MTKGETLDIKVTPISEVRNLLEAIEAGKKPAQKTKSTTVTGENFFSYLPAAMPQYTKENKADIKNNNEEAHKYLIITPLVNEWAFQDTNGFDPGDNQAVFRLPPAVVYALELPVAREWVKTLDSIDIKDNPFCLKGRRSEFFIATKNDAKDLKLLFN